MSVYHCPLCPLIFQYRTEVEWHLREEHRSGADEEADLRHEMDAAVRQLDWDLLQSLRSSAGGLSVSLLLGTTPAASMTVLDIARLRQLADQAHRRLLAEPHGDTAVPVVEHRVTKAVAAAEGSSTDRGLAIFVNQHSIAIITLPFEPRHRAVVDRAFATRDLEFALRRFPIFRVLLLGHCPRLFEGRGRDLSPVDSSRPDGPRHWLPARGDTGLQEADRLLDQRLRQTGDLPLVLIGDFRRRSAFRQQSRHADSIVAEAHRPRTRITAVADLVQAALARWQREQQDKTIAILRLADTHDQVSWGLASTWQAVGTKTAERVWVEHDFARPGRIVPGVEGVNITTDPTEPGAIDDLVDALIAKAHQQGIPVDLLDSGALGTGEPIAAKIGAADRRPHPSSEHFYGHPSSIGSSQMAARLTNWAPTPSARAI
jgi:hypothetical protein